MNTHDLSSSLTFGYKVIFPGLFFVAFGVLALRLVTREREPRLLRMLPALVWLLGNLFFVKFGIGVKRVSLHQHNLIISNFLRSETVPTGEITDVREYPWVKGNPITVTFRHPTSFGSKIMFYPKLRMFLLGSHPIASEIRQVARASASGGA